MNTFGTLFRLTTFGESHGPAVGGVVDGLPAGTVIDEDLVRTEMARRRPGQSALTTARKEEDDVQWLSGIFEGKATGAPIAFLIPNRDARPADYEPLKTLWRPSHADYTYDVKYGHRDWRGGGRASARETAARVVAGALARMVLRKKGISLSAVLSQVGDQTTPEHIDALIRRVAAEGDSIGGIVTCTINGCPAGLGEPVYDKLEASLASAMLSIPACHGFDYGCGFEGIHMTGSQQNDRFVNADGRITTATNHSGGIQGGISNGQPIVFRALFKPTATILRPQETLDHDGNPATLNLTGRHDPCVAVRAVPVVEAMAAIVILDHLLIARSTEGLID